MKIGLSLLILLLVVCCADAGLRDLGKKVKDKIKEGIKNTIDKIKTSLNLTDIRRIHEKFVKAGEKFVKKLPLSDENKEKLEKLLKKIVRVRLDHVNPEGDDIEQVNENAGIGEVLYQGDMVLTDEQADEILSEDSGPNRAKRQAFRNSHYPKTIWSDGVYYYFHPTASNMVRSVFKKAAALWSAETCIDFHEDVIGMRPHRIKVFKDVGCWSMVGKLNRVQELSLGKGCETIATAQHEIGHSLGFYHEQARHDRDENIIVNYDHIQHRNRDQFKKQSTHTNDNYGLPYDYGSTMQYGTHSGSMDGEPTMVPRVPLYSETLGSPFLGFYDKLMMNIHYGCLEKCKNSRTAAQCRMGGFPNPRDCSRCVCPSGYGGKLCDERPEGCGKELTARRDPQILEGEIGERSAGEREREDMTMCTFWLKAPPGSKIEVKIAKLTPGFTVDGCRLWGVEINTQQDQRLSGHRKPSDAKALKKTISTNLRPVIKDCNNPTSGSRRRTRRKKKRKKKNLYRIIVIVPMFIESYTWSMEIVYFWRTNREKLSRLLGEALVTQNYTEIQNRTMFECDSKVTPASSGAQNLKRGIGQDGNFSPIPNTVFHFGIRCNAIISSQIRTRTQTSCIRKSIPGRSVLHSASVIVS
ncbi:hypothetical protein RB195_004489 [Necator americanus]|uniref:Zinc metalloproteinase n=1 Tax=Necator americanus TaxID=51031 RepID=A0ABR1BM70_NECAM